MKQLKDIVVGSILILLSIYGGFGIAHAVHSFSGQCEHSEAHEGCSWFWCAHYNGK
jgi:hypothetical protein